MSLRISSAAFLVLALVLALAACSSGGGADGNAAQGAKGASEAPASVACALAGTRSFTAQCGLERASIAGQAIITLRHPDGGFRRLIELDGGKRFAAADGSDEVAIEANGAEIEVTLGEDHYLMPAPGAADAARR